MSDYLLNEGENLNEVLVDLENHPQYCRLCGKLHNHENMAFSFAECVHLLCKKKAGYSRWENIPASPPGRKGGLDMAMVNFDMAE